LFDEQIAYIINDAGDRLVFFDGEFLPIVKRVALSCPSVEAWVALGDVDIMPDASLSNLMDYEPLLSAESSSFSWPALDENMPALLCYTSGTTGAPKGVIYTHRSTVLHAYICALPDSQNLSAREVVMPVVPMFHVKAWETPFSAPLVGAKLVFPGGRLDGESLFTALEEQEVTLAMGVPTVWLNLPLAGWRRGSANFDGRCFFGPWRRAFARVGNDRNGGIDNMYPSPAEAQQSQSKRPAGACLRKPGTYFAGRRHAAHRR
jgi:fatty-acyl-CoA synthase